MSSLLPTQVDVNEFANERETTLCLHPDHLADLRKSGLTDQTISEAGIRTVPPGDIARALGFDIRAILSMMEIPYPGSDFSRFKPFPSLPDGPKYLQRKGSGCHLYVPPMVRHALGNISERLLLVEGEKKALAGAQAGLNCIGLGGLWNWIEDGRPIEELDHIGWMERKVTVIPDSDVWTRPDLMRAVYALGCELERRGAQVDVCLLPQVDGLKVGLDDYLLSNGSSEFQRLASVQLKHKGFSGCRDWHKEWTARKAATQESNEGALSILNRIEAEHYLHPAQDFHDGVLWYGIPARENVLLVNGHRKILHTEDLPDGLNVLETGFDLCRFSKDGIHRFLAGTSQSGAEVVQELQSYFRRFLILRDERIFLLFSLWSLGTYVHRIFRVYPYLSLRSPTKECGKSRTEDLLSLVCFNAGSRETSPSEASLFRLPGKNCGTLLLDEIEGLRYDKDRLGSLLSVLNSGFEKGGCVTRIEKRGEKFVDASYPTYCPRVLAGINKMADTLEGRSITIYLERKLRGEPVERFSRTKLFDSMQGTRDSIYIWALEHAQDVIEIYNRLDAFRDLAGIGDRERDLWEPLVALSVCCDAEDRGSKLTPIVVSLAHDLSKVRDQVDSANVRSVLKVLADVIGTRPEVRMSPTDLLRRFREEEHFAPWLKSTKALAGILTPLGLHTQSARDEDTKKVARLYRLRAGDIQDLCKRYGGEE